MKITKIGVNQNGVNRQSNRRVLHILFKSSQFSVHSDSQPTNHIGRRCAVRVHLANGGVVATIIRIYKSN